MGGVEMVSGMDMINCDLLPEFADVCSREGMCIASYER